MYPVSTDRLLFLDAGAPDYKARGGTGSERRGNGDMHDALEYAGRIKHEQKDFLTEQGIESIY